MNQAQSEAIAQWFDAYTAAFTAADTPLASMQRVKLEHSLRVAADAQRIAVGESWAAPDVRVAHVTGLLHDVGRFTQIAHFGTINDRKSVNHGEEGYTVLQRETVLTACGESTREDIATAVRYHNRREIPAALPGPALRLVRLVRDADKLDIFRVLDEAVRTNQVRECPDMVFDVDLDGPPTPELVSRVRQRQPVGYDTIRTLADFQLVQLGWLYDLNYAATCRLVRERRVAEMLAEHLPDTEDIRGIVRDIAQHLASRTA